MDVAPAGARPGLEACGRRALGLLTPTLCSPRAFLLDAGRPLVCRVPLDGFLPAGLGPGGAGAEFPQSQQWEAVNSSPSPQKRCPHSNPRNLVNVSPRMAKGTLPV